VCFTGLERPRCHRCHMQGGGRWLDEFNLLVHHTMHRPRPSRSGHSVGAEPARAAASKTQPPYGTTGRLREWHAARRPVVCNYTTHATPPPPMVAGVGAPAGHIPAPGQHRAAALTEPPLPCPPPAPPRQQRAHQAWRLPASRRARTRGGAQCVPLQCARAPAYAGRGGQVLLRRGQPPPDAPTGRSIQILTRLEALCNNWSPLRTHARARARTHAPPPASPHLAPPPPPRPAPPSPGPACWGCGT